MIQDLSARTLGDYLVDVSRVDLEQRRESLRRELGRSRDRLDLSREVTRSREGGRARFIVDPGPNKPSKSG